MRSVHDTSTVSLSDSKENQKSNHDDSSRPTTPPPKPIIAEIKEVIKLTKIKNIIIAAGKLSGNTVNNLKKKSYK